MIVVHNGDSVSYLVAPRIPPQIMPNLGPLLSVTIPGAKERRPAQKKAEDMASSWDCERWRVCFRALAYSPKAYVVPPVVPAAHIAAERAGTFVDRREPL